MQDFFTIIQQDYAVRALLCSGMVGILCGILGCFLVLRNMSLIGDALSHAILPGVVVGFMIMGYNILGFFTGSVIAGLVAAVCITLIQRNVKTREDAAIGIVFTTMFALGVIGISTITRKEGVHLDLKDFLFGNILGISDKDIWLTFLVLVFTIVCVIAFYRYFFITTFGSVVSNTLGISESTIHYFLMLLLSFAVVASLQSVGVILVVAMLITPASTGYLLTHNLKTMIVLSAIIGLIATTGGLCLAILLQTTPGPAMTLFATTLYILAVFFSPQKGLLIKWKNRFSLQWKIQKEDVLKLAVKLQEKNLLEVALLQKGSTFSPLYFFFILKGLQRSGVLKVDAQRFALTEKGKQSGYDLIRAHRLWETYLVDEIGMDSEHIHSEAEDLEHRLTETVLTKIESHLGYPQLDPHGSLIPRKQSGQSLMLTEIDLHKKAVLNVYAITKEASFALWKLGLNPNKPIEVVSKSNDYIVVQTGNEELTIPYLLAREVPMDWVIENK